ncbi:MAG TPA: ribosome maturation factor RimM [Acidimicrobiales bacterium]|jgi:16S rRNA processing protein RimM
MTAARRSLLEVGKIVRPHGLQGSVVVRLVTDQVDRLGVASVLMTDHGELTVRSSRPLKDRFVVAFEGVDSVEAAESLRGVVLRAAPLALDDVLWVDEVIGATVVTTDGRTLGVVEAVEANPASDLLVVEGGVLVPVRFVVGGLIDRTVTVDVPEGLV